MSTIRWMTVLLFFCAMVVAEDEKKDDKKEAVVVAAEINPVAVIKTSMGEIHVELFKDECPKTVDNFLGLATGTKEFTDPRTNEKTKRPYFDGLKFHRVIKGFMIQGGCPLGTGTGSPGYKFEDEINAKHLGLDKKMLFKNGRPAVQGIQPREFQRGAVQPIARKLGITSNEQAKARQAELIAELEKMSLMDLFQALGYRYNDTRKSHHPEKGSLAMANSGPNTNGSQFFINLGDTPHLAGKHTVFGKVIKGMEIVEKIGDVQVAAGNKPVEDVKIVSIRRLVATEMPDDE